MYCPIRCVEAAWIKTVRGNQIWWLTAPKIIYWYQIVAKEKQHFLRLPLDLERIMMGKLLLMEIPGLNIV